MFDMNLWLAFGLVMTGATAMLAVLHITGHYR